MHHSTHVIMVYIGLHRFTAKFESDLTVLIFFEGCYKFVFFLNYQLHQSHPISVVPNIFCPFQNLVGVPVTHKGVGKWV